MARSTKAATRDRWKLHEAKAQFSELFRLVREQGPQRVEKQGGDAVVVVAAEEFDRLAQRATQPRRLSEFFRSAPTGGKHLSLERNRDTTRRIDW